MFCAIEALEQVQQIVRYAFVLYRAVKRAQPIADIGIWTKPIVGLPQARLHALLVHQFVLTHGVVNTVKKMIAHIRNYKALIR